MSESVWDYKSKMALALDRDQFAYRDPEGLEAILRFASDDPSALPVTTNKHIARARPISDL